MTTLEPRGTQQHQAVVKKAYQAFFSPPQYQAKPKDREIIERGRSYRVPFKDGGLSVTTWGDQGPAVLLMHGWGGARAQMTGLVEPLLLAGYRVAAYDQPAHGESEGQLTNLLEIAPTMELIANREGSFDAIIAHSFGTLITSYVLANRDFALPTRLVYFGAFNRLMDSLPRFQVLAGLSAEVVDGLRDMIYENFGKDVLEAITNERLTQQLKIPALMFHDVTDDVTPVSDSHAIAKVWTSAQFIETSGLNHRGALQSKEIHEQVVNFLRM